MASLDRTADSQPPLLAPSAEEAAPPAAEQDSDDDASVSDVEVANYRSLDKFKTFRKHARDVYQSLATNEILWPCKSVDVMPYYNEAGQGCLEQMVVTGTVTSGQEQNYVKFMLLALPVDHTVELAGCEYDEELRELGAFGMAPASCRFKTDMLMAHDGDVRKVRIMPQNPNVIATSSSTERVYIFDRASILRTAPPNQPVRPLMPPMTPKPDKSAPPEVHRDFKLKCLNNERQLQAQARWDAKTHPGQHKLALDCSDVVNAWALDFSRPSPGRILVGGEEGVAVWSLVELKKTDAGADIPPEYRTAAVKAVNDAKWSYHEAHLIAASTGSGSGAGVAILDTRSADEVAAKCDGAAFAAGGRVANSVDWSPHDGNAFVVGGGDGGVHFFDLRNVTAGPSRSVFPHKAGSDVTVSWCPHDPAYVATGSADSNAAIVHAPSGATLFHHTGHTDAVMDVCWSPHDAFAGQIITCDDNAICAWKPRNQFFVPPS
jgi:histone-binding protein RBBP4